MAQSCSAKSFTKFMSAFLGLVTAALLLAGTATAQVDPDLFEGLRARAIGPATVSGRIAAIDVVQSDTNIIYAGTATGGLWKSSDGGLTWTPIFDDQDVNSIGAVAVYQPNPSIVWVGSGEGNVRNSTSIGAGIYKSIDGGRSFQKVGLEASERINRIALHPTNPDIAYVAAMGTLWSENEERGIFKTTDGGKSWQKILYVNEKTGATDIKIDPYNPNKLYAAMWEFRRWPYFFKSGGEGSGLYISYDGGETWAKKTEEDGLPKGEMGRAVIAPSPSQKDLIYAMVEAERSAIIRSTDGGESWTTVNDSIGIANRPFYYMELVVDPENENRVYNVASRPSRSDDGARNFSPIATINCCATGNDIHIDVHAWWINPENPRHMILGNDGGLAITYDMGETWRFIENLPVSQFYHINVDNDLPYHIYGGMQDNGSWRGPAEVWENAGIRNFHWQELSFGDGFDAAADPEDSMQGYSMSQGGSLSRWNLRTGEVSFIAPQSEDPETELRFNWNAGFAIDPFKPATIYYGSQFIHKSSDRGDSWAIISGDLTTNNPDWQTFKESGGLTPDVTAAENYTSITAIAPSPVREGVIWVGSDDGRVHVTKDGGQNWDSIEGRARGVPDNSWVPHIEASPHDPAVAFVVFDNHRRGDMKSYVYRVENYGRRWVSLTSKDISGYALSIQQDHVDPDLLFLGTEFGLFVSLDGGDDWFKWTAGVPTASVMDLAIQERESDLVLGTHGRSAYVIDDYSALRGLDKDSFDERLKILSITDGIAYEVKQSPSTRFSGSTGFTGENAPRGSMITFMMSGDDLAHPDEEKERARQIAARTAGDDDKEEEGPPPGNGKLTIEVTDGDGEVIRSFEAEVHQGINRVVWNMRRDGAKPVANGGSGRGNSVGPEVVPGTYQVTLKYGEAESSGEVAVIADPRFDISEADYQAKFDAQMEVQQLSERMNAALRAMTATASQLGTLKEIATRSKENMPETEEAEEGDGGEKSDPYGDFIKSIGEAEDGLKALELRFRPKTPSQGFTDNSDMVAPYIGNAGFYLGSVHGAPSPNARIAIAEAERRLEEALEAVKSFYAGTIEPIRAAADELGLEVLESYDPDAEEPE